VQAVEWYPLNRRQSLEDYMKAFDLIFFLEQMWLNIFTGINLFEQFFRRAFTFMTLVWNLTNTFGLHVSYDDGWKCFGCVNTTKEENLMF